eukprot:augustus_masked-scaffold_50-processed-gene-1.16-mRNA-1 protein AED:1.00 eAED:1.00 QI:0/-1/0/0/-1/1/1/0/891
MNQFYPELLKEADESLENLLIRMKESVVLNIPLYIQKDIEDIAPGFRDEVELVKSEMQLEENDGVIKVSIRKKAFQQDTTPPQKPAYRKSTTKMQPSSSIPFLKFFRKNPGSYISPTKENRKVLENKRGNNLSVKEKSIEKNNLTDNQSSLEVRKAVGNERKRKLAEVIKQNEDKSLKKHKSEEVSNSPSQNAPKPVSIPLPEKKPPEIGDSEFDLLAKDLVDVDYVVNSTSSSEEEQKEAKNMFEASVFMKQQKNLIMEPSQIVKGINTTKHNIDLSQKTNISYQNLHVGNSTVSSGTKTNDVIQPDDEMNEEPVKEVEDARVIENGENLERRRSTEDILGGIVTATGAQLNPTYVTNQQLVRKVCVIINEYQVENQKRRSVMTTDGLGALKDNQVVEVIGNSLLSDKGVEDSTITKRSVNEKESSIVEEQADNTMNLFKETTLESTMFDDSSLEKTDDSLLDGFLLEGHHQPEENNQNAIAKLKRKGSKTQKRKKSTKTNAKDESRKISRLNPFSMHNIKSLKCINKGGQDDDVVLKKNISGRNNFSQSESAETDVGLNKLENPGTLDMGIGLRKASQVQKGEVGEPSTTNAQNQPSSKPSEVSEHGKRKETPKKQGHRSLSNIAEFTSFEGNVKNSTLEKAKRNKERRRSALLRELESNLLVSKNLSLNKKSTVRSIQPIKEKADSRTSLLKGKFTRQKPFREVGRSPGAKRVKDTGDQQERRKHSVLKLLESNLIVAKEKTRGKRRRSGSNNLSSKGLDELLHSPDGLKGASEHKKGKNRFLAELKNHNAAVDKPIVANQMEFGIPVTRRRSASNVSSQKSEQENGSVGVKYNLNKKTRNRSQGMSPLLKSIQAHLTAGKSETEELSKSDRGRRAARYSMKKLVENL